MSDRHGIFTQLFLDPDAIFISHTMFINASTEEFTLVNNAIPSYDIAFKLNILRDGCQCLLKYWQYFKKHEDIFHF